MGEEEENQKGLEKSSSIIFDDDDTSSEEEEEEEEEEDDDDDDDNYNNNDDDDDDDEPFHVSSPMIDQKPSILKKFIDENKEDFSIVDESNHNISNNTNKSFGLQLSFLENAEEICNDVLRDFGEFHSFHEEEEKEEKEEEEEEEMEDQVMEKLKFHLCI